MAIATVLKMIMKSNDDKYKIVILAESKTSTITPATRQE